MLHPSPTRVFKYHKREIKHTRINMKKDNVSKMYKIP
jgi:hypothetical protein